MKEKLLKILIFLRIVDAHDSLLSLTNIAVIIALIKLGMAHSASMTDLGSLFSVLLAYSGKKYINNNNGSNNQ
jgi:hypothetical protein